MNDPRVLWRFARACALLAPLFLLVGDCIAIWRFNSISWTLLLWLSFVCFIPALAGLTVALSRTAPLLAVVAGAIVLVGTMAGAGMQAFFRTAIVLRNGGQESAVDFLRTQSILPVTTQVPGLFFPLGLLLLAFGLWRGRLAAGWVAAMLALGAILFPIGHAAGISWALLAGDLVLLVAFALLAQQVLRRDRSKFPMNF